MLRRLGLALLIALAAAAPARADLAAEVDPMIGTFPPGFVVPGAATPFGMVQNSPDTTGEFAYSGYLWTDGQIRGFSLVHLSGPGVRKGGDIPFMPTLGPGTSEPNAYAQTFDHAREEAEPGYYKVVLHESQTKVELTASARAAMQRYTFAPSPRARVIMDTRRSGEGVAPASWRVTGPNEVVGWRKGRYPVYFVARFSRPFKGWQSFEGGDGGWVGFDTTVDRKVTVRVGVSFVDLEGARRNLQAEAPDYDFEGMRSRARAAWNEELGRVEVDGGSAPDRTAFYTALYHAFLHPNVFSDVDGRYRGFDDVIRLAEGRTQYANFSSWDTYKGSNQLLALLQGPRYHEMLLSLLADARQGGHLPRWAEWDFDAGHMSGDPAIPMIADGYCRGLIDGPAMDALYDASVALRARRPAEYDALGYLPDRPGTTLEFGVADFALALMAHRLGRGEEAERFANASLAYRNILDPETGWIRPRHADGSWQEPFDPALDETGFQEGNSWQYSWLAPHDAPGLFDRMGGHLVAGDRFDTFFAGPAPVQTTLTFMGVVYRLPQYAPGNEHDIQAPWMPAWMGRAWQVADATQNARTAFRATPDGLPGNDDLGGLSGWHVLSSLGLGTPIGGAPLYVIGSPQFERARLNLPGGRFTIAAPGASVVNRYVQSARLDGAPHEGAWVLDSALRDGGSLELTMGSGRSAWGAPPPSLSTHPLEAFGC